MIYLYKWFTNICVIFTLTFCIMHVYWRAQFQTNTRVLRYILFGLVQGFIGLLLVYNSVVIDGFRIDLRYIAIITAALYGGWYPTLLSAAVIFLGRLLLFPATAGNVPGFINIALVGIGCALLCSLKADIWRKWTYMVVHTMMVTAILYVLFSKNPTNMNLRVIGLYCVMTVIGGATVQYFIEYIRNSNKTSRNAHRHATTDYLTGVHNARKFDQVLSRSVQTSFQQQESMSLIYIDVDYFKKINDTHGHIIGDEVLKAISTTISSCCRQGDKVFRIGGDEFSIILADCSEQEAYQVADRICMSVSATPVSIGNTHITTTVSVGVAINRSEEPRALMQRADEGLYIAKNTGRNRVGVVNVS